MPWYPGHKPKNKKHQGSGKLFMINDEWKTLQDVADLAGSSIDDARRAMYHDGMNPEKFIEMKRNGTN
jgi:hypothetical protein